MKRIYYVKKIYIFFAMYRTYIFFTTVVYLITFGLNLLGIFSKGYSFSSASYNLPQAMSFLLTVLLLCNIFIVYYRRRITPIPKGWKWWRHLIDYFEVILIAVQMLTFGFIPHVQAETEMMLGRGFKKNFYATEKVKMKK